MPIRIRINFQLLTENFDNFLVDLLNPLIAASTSKGNIPVIGPVNNALPWNWGLVGIDNGRVQICLLIRLDNLYLYGWRKGLSDEQNKNPFFLVAGEDIKNAPPCFEQRLPFGGNYSGLSSTKICVNPSTISKAVDVLHETLPNAVQHGASKAFLILILAFCASTRIVLIRKCISDAFASADSGLITSEMFLQEKNWSNASDAFVKEEQTKCKGFGIITNDNVSEMIFLALWSSHSHFDNLLPPAPGWDAQQPDARGGRQGPRGHGRGQGGRRGGRQGGRQWDWQGGRQWGQQWGRQHGFAAGVMHKICYLQAAMGILTYFHKYLDQLKESWYEKLQRWDEALHAYSAKSSQASSTNQNLDATLGRMRCLAALAWYEKLNAHCREQWTAAEPAARLEMAPMAANAAWSMGEWDQMSEYVSWMDNGGDESRLHVLGNTAASGDGNSNGAFFRAVLLVRREKYDEAREYVDRARKCLATELAALVLESYEWAYISMVRVQQLSELEEVTDYCTLPMGNPIADGRRELTRTMWNEHIKGAKRNVEAWQAIIAVRKLVLPPTEDIETWLKFASLCRKSGRTSQARSTLIKLLQYNPESVPEMSLRHGHPQVMAAYLKYQWSLGDDMTQCESFSRLQELTMQLANSTNGYSGIQPSALAVSSRDRVPLLAKVYLRLGTWKRALSPGLDDESIREILQSFKNATICAKDWGKAWHKWALFNTAVMSHYTNKGRSGIVGKYVAAAVTGYFYSIACASTSKGVDDSLQAQLVSKELIRVAIVWHEMWYEAFDEASYFGEHNIEGMLAVLEPLHAMLEKGAETVKEDAFIQLYGSVNTLLVNSRNTAEKDLSIQRYEVIPLSPNNGLIGWVPNCDTLHQLIREYRDASKIFLNQEHRLMLAFAPDYDNLPLITKVEVFEHALQNTDGHDLDKVLWLKSRTSVVWLERRTNYTRILAVMSMVGYLLGLGDRHPSNLILHRYSGKILHIDFGDCFEASMNREKFPEKVPFRLTCMLVNVMEVSGIEGNFRSTCENVMQVLRTNKDGAMAMIEAFMHDPLINWRLFNFNEVPQVSTMGNTYVHPIVNTEDPNSESKDLAHPPRGACERELLQAVNQQGDANVVPNVHAVAVMESMRNKLTGRDFSLGSSPSSASAGPGLTLSGTEHSSGNATGETGRDAEHGLSVKDQVQNLILQARYPENLCQSYVG